MKWLRTILREIVGLLVDDVSFAAAILVWVVVVWLVLPHLPLPASAAAVIFFVGLATILIESTSRYARSHRRP